MKLEAVFPLPKIIKTTDRLALKLREIKFWDEESSPLLTRAAQELAEENQLSFRTVGSGQANLRLTRDKQGTIEIPRSQSEEGYQLKIAANEVRIYSFGRKGAFYGLQTLRQILARTHDLKETEIIDWPDMPFRGVHLTLGNGHMPKFENMLALIKTLALYKTNYLVIEYDDRFQWRRHRAISHPDAFSKREIKQLVSTAEENFMEVIPLLDSLGHANQYLRHKKYAYLREIPGRDYQMCPARGQTLKFMKELWEEVLELHPNSHYAHITGDEVFRTDLCPVCQDYAQKGQLGRLYADYYKKLSRWIIGKGKIPMMWADAFIRYPQALRNFPRDVVFCDWCYNGIDKPYWDIFPWFLDTRHKTMDMKDREKLFGKYWFGEFGFPKLTPFPYYRFFKEQGFRVIGSAAASSENKEYPFPSPTKRFSNNKRFAMTVKDNNGLGLLNTYWSNVEPVESAWYGLLAGADFSWHARDENEEIFCRRFIRSFSGINDAFFPKSLMLLDKHLYGVCRYRNKPEKKTLTDAEKIVRRCRAAKRNAKRNRVYLELLEWMAKVNFLSKRLENTIDETNRLLLGRGRDFPVDLRKQANNDFHCNSPSSFSSSFSKKLSAHKEYGEPIAMKTGRREIGGVKFDIIRPEKNNGKSVVCSTDNGTSIAIRQKAERLYFLYTHRYGITAGTALGKITFFYSNGKERRMPVVEGKNILYWGKKPVPMKDAIVAWEGRTKVGVKVAVYLSWWDNPLPEAEVKSLELKSAGKNCLVLIGLTARRNTLFPAPINKKRISGRELKKDLAEMKNLRNALRKIYEKIMPKNEAREGIKISPALSYLQAWVNHYQKICGR